MNWITIVAALVPISVGVLTAVLRWRAPDSKWIGKYRAMQEQFGATAGTVIHTFSYTVVPLVVGAGMIYAGMNGLSLVDLIKR